MLRRSYGAEAAIERLRSIPLFAGLGETELRVVDQSLTETIVNTGTRLTAEGRNGYEFCVIVEGLASVTRGGQEIQRLEAGDFFGEHALLRHRPRSADVLSLTPMRLFVSSATEFDRLVRDLPAVGDRLRQADRERQHVDADRDR